MKKIFVLIFLLGSFCIGISSVSAANSLNITLLNQTGSPISNANVNYYEAGTSNSICDGTTNSNGLFGCDPNLNKIYDINITTSNFHRYQQNIWYKAARAPANISVYGNTKWVPESTLSTSKLFTAGHIVPVEIHIFAPWTSYLVANISLEDSTPSTASIVSNILFAKYNSTGSYTCDVLPNNSTYYYIDKTSCSFLNYLNVIAGEWIRVSYRLRIEGPSAYSSIGQQKNYTLPTAYLRFDVVTTDTCHDVSNNTQVAGCDGACQACQSGTCGVANVGTDPGNECGTTGCLTGNCKGGTAVCDWYSDNAEHNCTTACTTCNGATSGSCVNMADNTQDTQGSYTCSATCKKCSSGSCVNQLSSEDLFGQCAAFNNCAVVYCSACGNTCTGYCTNWQKNPSGLCNDVGSCANVACGCESIGYQSDGTGGRYYYFWNGPGQCLLGSGGTCGTYLSSSDWCCIGCWDHAYCKCI